VQAFDNTTVVAFGPAWPTKVNGTAWEANLLSGITIDRMVFLGGGIDFLWKTQSSDSSYVSSATSSDQIIVTGKQSSFMFPLYGTLGLDPLPDLIVHPMAMLSVGINPLRYNKQELDPATQTLKDADKGNGFYFGPYVKLNVDALYSFTPHATVLLGFAYAWTTPSQSGSGSVQFKRTMSGAGLRLGFLFSL
jgi:hypothetical protein